MTAFCRGTSLDGEFLVGVLCLQSCGELQGDLQESAWNCCFCLTAQMCTMAPGHPLQEKLTHKWPFNLLLYPIWLSHVASAFHCTAANLCTANPCLIMSTGLSAHCDSVWLLLGNHTDPWNTEGSRSVLVGTQVPDLQHLMKTLEGFIVQEGAVHWRYLPQMLYVHFRMEEKQLKAM